jgi:hypothetical protein
VEYGSGVDGQPGHGEARVVVPEWGTNLPSPAYCMYPGAGCRPCLVCGDHFYMDDRFVPVRRWGFLWTRGWIHTARHVARRPCVAKTKTEGRGR